MFRIYDASDPVDTLATSRAWQVDAQGKDVEHSVRFVLNQLCNTDGKGSVMGALAQLAHLLGHLEARVVGMVGLGVGCGLSNALEEFSYTWLGISRIHLSKACFVVLAM